MPANRLIATLIRRVFAGTPEFRRYGQPAADAALEPADGATRHDEAPPGPVDYLFATAADPREPGEVFDRLRWGGQFVFASPSASVMASLAARFGEDSGFVLERGPTRLGRSLLGVPLPLGPRLHYFAARKVMLIQPGQSTDRFTYDVRLVKRASGAGSDCAARDAGYLVQKQIPTLDNVTRRLRERFPGSDETTVLQGAHKLVDKVFPVFLSREAAFLHILQRDLPADYRARVPRVVDLEKDSRGLVVRLYLNWLRSGTGGKPLSHLEFARQSVDLLRVLHDAAAVIHMDLRLDNLVITDEGVSFVDFGSAVRVGEDLAQSPMLATLFREMMSTSSVQQLLGRMKHHGKITSPVITEAHRKLDKAVDMFHLSVQMNHPHDNPDFENLVSYDKHGPEAKAVARLTREILKPRDPNNPEYRTAADVLAGLDRIELGA